jgi:hypothetical protein
MKIEIDVDHEIADLLIVENLKQTVADLKNDLERREEGKGISIFSTDPIEDVAEIIRHINAFETTLSYFGTE